MEGTAIVLTWMSAPVTHAKMMRRVLSQQLMLVLLLVDTDVPVPGYASGDYFKYAQHAPQCATLSSESDVAAGDGNCAWT